MNLKNQTILVTRPKPQGDMLCELIRTHGGHPIYFPTIEIIPPKNLSELKNAIAVLDQCDWLIFMSPQAVYQSEKLIHAAWPVLPSNLKIAAVGAGTAEVLREANLSPDIYPEKDWRSEGILNLPVFQNVKDKKIALMHGEGGREFLAEKFVELGATVIHLIAYQRALPKIDVNEYQNLLRDRKIDIVICTSNEGLQNLKMLLGDIICDVPVVVVSDRIKARAQELGFKKIKLASNASHEAILKIICL